MKNVPVVVLSIAVAFLTVVSVVLLVLLVQEEDDCICHCPAIDGAAGEGSTSPALTPKPHVSTTAPPGGGGGGGGGPANAVCTGASQIKLGESVFANTVTADKRMGINVGCGSNYRTTGLWYAVEGDGGRMTATTCRPETEASFTVSVYKDSCFSPEIECVDWDNGVLSMGSCKLAQGHPGTASWDSTPGTTYYIFVHAYSSVNEGYFELLVTSEPNR